MRVQDPSFSKRFIFSPTSRHSIPLPLWWAFRQWVQHQRPSQPHSRLVESRPQPHHRHRCWSRRWPRHRRSQFLRVRGEITLYQPRKFHYNIICYIISPWMKGWITHTHRRRCCEWRWSGRRSCCRRPKCQRKRCGWCGPQCRRGEPETCWGVPWIIMYPSAINWFLTFSS